MGDTDKLNYSVYMINFTNVPLRKTPLKAEGNLQEHNYYI